MYSWILLSWIFSRWDKWLTRFLQAEGSLVSPTSHSGLSIPLQHPTTYWPFSWSFPLNFTLPCKMLFTWFPSLWPHVQTILKFNFWNGKWHDWSFGCVCTVFFFIFTIKFASLKKCTLHTSFVWFFILAIRKTIRQTIFVFLRTVQQTEHFVSQQQNRKRNGMTVPLVFLYKICFKKLWKLYLKVTMNSYILFYQVNGKYVLDR